MEFNNYIECDRLIIRDLLISDISDSYIDWLNDPAVNKYLEVRHIWQDNESVINYVKSFQNREDIMLLGIFIKETNQHIGNITFSTINKLNDSGVIGIAIGNKNFWGFGYALEALRGVIKYAFKELNLHRLEAGISINNKASRKLFEKAGFIVEGIKKESGKFDNKYIDSLIYGIIS